MSFKRKGTVDWTPIYLLLVIAIAAVLLITFVKPMFSGASSAASKNFGQVKSLVGSSAQLIALVT